VSREYDGPFQISDPDRVLTDKLLFIVFAVDEANRDPPNSAVKNNLYTSNPLSPQADSKRIYRHCYPRSLSTTNPDGNSSPDNTTEFSAGSAWALTPLAAGTLGTSVVFIFDTSIERTTPVEASVTTIRSVVDDSEDNDDNDDDCDNT
jgi:hypothetical protein